MRETCAAVWQAERSSEQEAAAAATRRMTARLRAAQTQAHRFSADLQQARTDLQQCPSQQVLSPLHLHITLEFALTVCSHGCDNVRCSYNVTACLTGESSNLMTPILVQEVHAQRKV